MTSMKDSASLRIPKTVGNYNPQHCLEFLEKFDVELRDTWPEMHTFVHELVVLHLGSGKKILRDSGDITLIEGAAESSQGLATPRRPATRSRTAPIPASPPARATSGTALSSTQRETYIHMPAVWASWNKLLASFIRMAFPEAARRTIVRVCGDDGLYTLEHLEARGRAAAGSAFQLTLLNKLELRQRRGVGTPTVANWELYAQELHSLATSSGGVDEAQLLIRLRAGVYALPDTISTRAVDASASATTPDALVTAVSAFLEAEEIRTALTASYRAATDPRHDATSAPPHPALAASLSDDGLLPALAAGMQRIWDPARHRPCSQRGQPGCTDGRHFDFDCPRRRDPPMNVTPGGQPPRSTAAVWSAMDHSACLNWRRGREGCDGRHHLPQCPLPPLPRTAGAVALEDEDAPPPPPAPALTVTPTISAAEADFAELFSLAGPAEMRMPALTVRTVHDDVSRCDGCDDHDGYATASECGDDSDTYVLADEDSS
jgi:hypothetical protein